MDINVTPQVALPQNTQPQQAPNATAQANATATVQNVPDNVVTAATDAARTNSQEEDALRRQQRSVREQGVPALQDLEINGLTTRIRFDADRDRVFIEILLPQSGEVIQQIPSEYLIEFLQSQVAPVNDSGTGAGSQAFDRSI